MPTTAPCRQHLAACCSDIVRVRRGDKAEIDDPGLRRVKRAQTRGVRLQLAQPLGADQLETGHTVRRPSPLQLLESRELGLRRRDDDLAAKPVRNLLLVAVTEECLCPLHAQPRLQRARCVVEATVDDAARAPRLVAGDPALGLERRPAAARVGAAAARGRRQPEDAAADTATSARTSPSVAIRPACIRAPSRLRAASGGRPWPRWPRTGRSSTGSPAR